MIPGSIYILVIGTGGSAMPGAQLGFRCRILSVKILHSLAHLGLELAGDPLLDGGVEAHGHHLDGASKVLAADLRIQS